MQAPNYDNVPCTRHPTFVSIYAPTVDKTHKWIFYTLYRLTVQKRLQNVQQVLESAVNEVATVEKIDGHFKP